MAAVSDEILTKLKNAARKVSDNAYTPYSHFPVGAAVLGGSGKIYAGCNVENASFGLTICAERNAVFSAIAGGEKKIIAIALYTPTDSKTPPCGACRQVIYEFNTQTEVYIFNRTDDLLKTNIQELLPAAFGPDDIL